MNCCTSLFVLCLIVCFFLYYMYDNDCLLISDRKRRKKKVQKVPNSVSAMSHGITSSELNVFVKRNDSSFFKDM